MLTKEIIQIIHSTNTHLKSNKCNLYAAIVYLAILRIQILTVWHTLLRLYKSMYRYDPLWVRGGFRFRVSN